MLMQAQVLSCSTKTQKTQRNPNAQKTRMKVMDIGAEAAGGDVYWLDFWEEAALSDEENAQVHRQQVQIEIRRVVASPDKKQPGRVYLNVSGGAVLLGGQIVQRGLRATAARSA
jgi:hypothetical protein